MQYRPWLLLFFLLLIVGCQGSGDLNTASSSDASAVDSETQPDPQGQPDSIVATTPSAPFITILGIAQDGGFPHVGCECEHCQFASDQSEPFYVSSLALQLTDGSVFLFDATPDLPDQLKLLGADNPLDPSSTPSTMDRNPVDGIFLTHAHMGHYLGLAYFGFEALNSHKIPTYATPAMQQFLKTQAPWDQLVRFENIALKSLIPDTPIVLSDHVQVIPFKVPHRDEYADTVGYRIEGPNRTVMFIPDTDRWNVWNPPLTDRLEGVDLALLDATFYSGDELPGRDLEAIRHPFITESMDLLSTAVNNQNLDVWFIHLNHSNAALFPHSKEREALEEAGFEVAREGRRYGL